MNPIANDRFSEHGISQIREIVQAELQTEVGGKRKRLQLNWNVDDVFETSLINLLAVWSSAHNPTEDRSFTLELMDRLGWFIERASAVYHDAPLLDIGSALRDVAKARGFNSDLPE